MNMLTHRKTGIEKKITPKLFAAQLIIEMASNIELST